MQKVSKWEILRIKKLFREPSSANNSSNEYSTILRKAKRKEPKWEPEVADGETKDISLNLLSSSMFRTT